MESDLQALKFTEGSVQGFFKSLIVFAEQFISPGAACDSQPKSLRLGCVLGQLV